MLQYPTNFYPENVAIDRSLPQSDDTTKLRFTFNGDILTCLWIKVFDYATGALVTHRLRSAAALLPWKYNGDEVEILNMFSACTNGNDYVVQMILAQCNQTGTGNIYDMPVLGGSLQETMTSATSLKIEDGIENIYEWGYDNGLYKPTFDDYDNLVIGMVIQIGDETRVIESYDKSTGEIVVDSAFTSLQTEGTHYQIYSNYLVSPQYYFMCRTTPVITPSVEWDERGALCSLSYTQAENAFIKYAELSLYTETGTTPLASSGKIFSQRIVWRAGIDYTADGGGSVYRLGYKVVTQDNMVVDGSYNSTSQTELDAPIHTDVQLNDSKRTVQLRVYSGGGAENFGARMYRKDLNSGKSILVNVKDIAGSGYIDDYTASNHGRYEYRCVPYDASGLTTTIYVTDPKEVSTNWYGYTITALYDSGGDVYDKPYFQVGDTWTFMADIEDTTVSQNGDKTLHVGYGQFPTVSSTEVNYSSGTVSGMLGYLECATKTYIDTIELVKAWREFIMQPCPFVLKSQKGDVWIVNITDAPSTSYQENAPSIPTRFTFSWAECAKADDVMISNLPPPSNLLTDRR